MAGEAGDARPTTSCCGWSGCSSGSASARSASPAASRCCAGPWSDVVASHRRPRAATADRHDHQRDRSGPLGASRWPTPGSTASTSASTRSTPRSSPTSPVATACTTSRPGSRLPPTAGLVPVKVNAVAMRGINDDSVADLLQWCLDRGYELRFIEQMPLDAQHGWDASTMVSSRRDARAARRAVHPHPAARRSTGGALPPSGSWWTADPQTVGIIASVTDPFCAACDRTRLTADGQVRNCLFSAGRDRPARPVARRSQRRGARRASSRARCGARRPATGSAPSRASSSRTARCPPSAAEALFRLSSFG